MSRKYDQAYENEWWNPKMRGFRHMCCDCALVHDVDFKIVDGQVWTRWRTNNRATAAARRVFKEE